MTTHIESNQGRAKPADGASSSWSAFAKPLESCSVPKVVVIAPVFNDFPAATLLIRELGHVLQPTSPSDVLVLIVNDGSFEAPPADFPEENPPLRVGVLHLKANLGHQRAIAVALGFVSQWVAPDATVVVMDADGQDRPEDVPKLLEASSRHPEKIVVAERLRRSEPLLFRIGYVCYRGLFRLLTGMRIRHGNFSAMSGRLAQRLAHVTGLWNHYAATVQISRIPLLSVNVDRDDRYAGTSHMNLTGLVVHGLSAISVHMETAGVRMLIGAMALSVLAGLGLGAVLVVRLATDLAIPGWASLLGASFVILGALGLMFSAQLVFTVLAARVRLPVIAAVDAVHFVRDFELSGR